MMGKIDKLGYACPSRLEFAQGAPRAIRWLSTVCFGVALLAGSSEAGATAPKSVAKAKVTGKALEHAELKHLRIAEGEDGSTVLRISGVDKPSFNVYRVSEPDRVVLEVAGALRGQLVPRVDVDNWLVGRISVRDREREGHSTVQLDIELERDASYIVVPSQNELVVTLTPRATPSAAYLAARKSGDRHALAKARKRGYGAAPKASAAAHAAAQQAAERAARDRLAAEHVLERARRTAASSEAAQVAAAERLESAQTVLDQTRAELAQVQAAKKQAQSDLRALQKRSKAAKRPSAATLDGWKAELAAARRQRDEAAARANKMQQDYEKAQAERTRLQNLIAAEKRRRGQLDSAVAGKGREIDQLRQRIANKERDVQQLAKRPTREVVKKEEQEVARVKAARFALEEDLRRLETRESESQAQIAALKNKLARSSGTSARTAAGLQKQLAAKQAQLTRVAREIAGRRADLTGLDEKLAIQRSQLKELVAANRAMRARHSQFELERAQAKRKAKAQLQKARKALATLENSIASETQRLATLEKQIEKARRRLDHRLRDDSPGAEQVVAKTETAAPSRGAVPLRDIRFETTRSGHRLVLDVPEDVTWNTHALTPTTIQLTMPKVLVAEAFRQRKDLREYDGPIESVTTFQDGESARIVVATREGAKGRLERSERGLVWNFELDAPAEVTADRAPHALRVPSGEVAGFVGKTPTAAMRMAARRGGGKRWRGDRIDIELHEAPIKDVLLLFSDIGRVNIIAGTSVAGVVSMKLSSVPWDQALDIILRALSLGMVQEGNVIRVATVGELEEERVKAIERANAQVQLKPLRTRLVPLSYATVDEMLAKVQSVLSARGTVTPDSRTNTLIIMDVAENIALAEELIGQLDSQTPQVLIEARIVEARTSWLRQLGIQWGFDYRASAGTGNPTGLIFPNSIGVGGGSTGSESNTQGLILGHAVGNPNYAVDLPAPAGPGSGGSVGFSFGSIAGNLNTNLRLSAAEDEGEVRLISAPKVVTMDNTLAEIEQGVQIPISQVSSEGVNTRYVNATLALRVTPHVTNEGSVVLEVEVQKNEADFINTGARGDPTILTKQARSRMLIIDGDTAVIGGIYTRNQSTNRKKVPWVADIPIIGWFFKNRSEVDTRTELLIFLTPKIINRSSSIGG